MATFKSASDIKTGDTVRAEDGAAYRVTRTSRGFWSGSVMLEWRGGWACVSRTDIVEVTA